MILLFKYLGLFCGFFFFKTFILHNTMGKILFYYGQLKFFISERGTEGGGGGCWVSNLHIYISFILQVGSICSENM